MSRVTSKLQVTIPKAVAVQYGIRPGDEVAWEPAGDVIRVIPGGAARPPDDIAFRLELYDAAMERHRRRSRRRAAAGRRSAPADRGWTRQELYDRGGAR